MHSQEPTIQPLKCKLSKRENDLEDIRRILFGATLAEAYKKHICIHCKRSIDSEISDWPDYDIDHWLDEGHCPTCYDLRNQYDKLTYKNVRYAK